MNNANIFIYSLFVIFAFFVGIFFNTLILGIQPQLCNEGETVLSCTREWLIVIGAYLAILSAFIVYYGIQKQSSENRFLISLSKYEVLKKEISFSNEIIKKLNQLEQKWDELSYHWKDYIEEYETLYEKQPEEYISEIYKKNCAKTYDLIDEIDLILNSESAIFKISDLEHVQTEIDALRIKMNHYSSVNFNYRDDDKILNDLGDIYILCSYIKSSIFQIKNQAEIEIVGMKRNLYKIYCSMV